MSRRRRVVSPRIQVPHGPGPAILLVVLWLAAIAGAFYAGLFMALEEKGAAVARLETLKVERDGLAERIEALSQEQLVLQRTIEIDRDANRAAQEGLKQVQDERLALEKEVSFLKQLIKQGGGGILKVQDFKLVAAETPGETSYSFMVSQLIQDFGESAGNVLIRVVGKRGDKEVTLTLDKLPGSEPTAHPMRFKHFQNFTGRIRLPDDLKPENLVVEVKPSTKNLIPVTETFAWSTGG